MDLDLLYLENIIAPNGFSASFRPRSLRSTKSDSATCSRCRLRTWGNYLVCAIKAFRGHVAYSNRLAITCLSQSQSRNAAKIMAYSFECVSGPLPCSTSQDGVVFPWYREQGNMARDLVAREASTPTGWEIERPSLIDKDASKNLNYNLRQGSYRRPTCEGTNRLGRKRRYIYTWECCGCMAAGIPINVPDCPNCGNLRCVSCAVQKQER